jgi:lysyl-tRNA synthetase, class II
LNSNFKFEVSIFSKLVEKNLIKPIFIRNFPKEVCPLACIHKNNNFLIDTFELFIVGREIAPGYSEQNDPFSQSKFFKKQKGLKNTIYDINFLNSLVIGMPPSGGLGLGIDRLNMILFNLKNIQNSFKI